VQLVAITIDLDELRFYRAIHGLPSGDGAAGHVVHDVAVPRAMEWATRLGIPLTFFVVGADLDDDAVTLRLRSAIERGHAVESHSLTHPYDLVRRTDREIDREVRGSFARIAERLGERPRGFRAPGYTCDARVLESVARADAFDSSTLPSPAYWAAKVAAIGGLALRGKRSRAIIGSPRQAFAERSTHRLTRAAVLELPIAATRGARIPIIGTTLGWAGSVGAKWLVSQASDLSLLNVELHGIDFLDRGDVPTELQSLPELSRPLVSRLAAFQVALLGRRAVRLRDVAARAWRVD